MAINPKKFWKCVNSKRRCQSKIGDLEYIAEGKTKSATEDKEKAEACLISFALYSQKRTNTAIIVSRIGRL